MPRSQIVKAIIWANLHGQYGVAARLIALLPKDPTP